MRKTQTLFTCNLCCGESQADKLENLTKSGKWITFTVDDPMQDRSWHQVEICSSCVASFKEALRKIDNAVKEIRHPMDY